MAAHFREILRLTRSNLNKAGFQGRGDTLIRTTGEGNRLFVNIQRSRHSTAEDILATVNVGVVSARLARISEFENSDPLAAHWRIRLRADGREEWLHLCAGQGAASGAAALTTAVESLLPTLVAHATDQALLEEWANGRSPGLTNYERLLYMVVLANDLGHPSLLAESIRDLKELARKMGNESATQQTLARAGVKISFAEAPERS